MFVGCSKDEESGIELSYGFEALEVSFQSVGESTAPVVVWNGEVGTFSVKNPVDGIAIDPGSGVLTWEKALALGENSIVVVAQNSATSTEVALNIKSTLAGTFWIGWDNVGISEDPPMLVTFDRQFAFKQDGSITVQANSLEDPIGVGVWSSKENIIELRFSINCPLPDPFLVPEIDEHSYYLGTISNNGDEGAAISGEWYRVDFNPDYLETLIGQFGLRISNEFFELF